MALASKLTGGLDASTFGMDMFDGDVGERFMEQGFLDNDSESSHSFNAAEFGLHTSSSTDAVFADAQTFSRQRGLSIDLSTLPAMLGGTRPRVFSLDFAMLPTDMVELESLEAGAFHMMEVEAVDPGASFDASAAVIANSTGVPRGRGSRSFSVDSSCLESFKMTPALQARCKTVVSKAPRSRNNNKKSKKSKKGGSSSSASVSGSSTGDAAEENDMEVARWTDNPIYSRNPVTKNLSTVFFKFAGAGAITSSKPPSHPSFSAKIRKQEEKKAAKNAGSSTSRSVGAAVAKAAVGSLSKTSPLKSPVKSAISSPVISKAKLNAGKSKAVKKAANELASANKKDDSTIQNVNKYSSSGGSATNHGSSNQSSRGAVGTSNMYNNKSSMSVSSVKSSNSSVSRKTVPQYNKGSSGKVNGSLVGGIGVRGGVGGTKGPGRDQHDSNEYIGSLTIEQRKVRIARFLEKRRRRVWKKKVKYGCRKKLADSRPRVKGRFVPRAVQNQVMAEQKDGANNGMGAMGYNQNSKQKTVSKAGMYPNKTGMSRPGMYGTAANGYKKPTTGYRPKPGVMVNNKMQKSYVNTVAAVAAARKTPNGNYVYNNNNMKGNMQYNSNVQQSRMMQQNGTTNQQGMMKPGMRANNMTAQMQQYPRTVQNQVGNNSYTNNNGAMNSRVPGVKGQVNSNQARFTNNNTSMASYQNSGNRSGTTATSRNTMSNNNTSNQQMRYVTNGTARGNVVQSNAFKNQKITTPTGTKPGVGTMSNISPQVNNKAANNMSTVNRTGQQYSKPSSATQAGNRPVYVNKPGTTGTVNNGQVRSNMVSRPMGNNGTVPYKPAQGRPTTSNSSTNRPISRPLTTGGVSNGPSKTVQYQSGRPVTANGSMVRPTGSNTVSRPQSALGVGNGQQKPIQYQNGNVRRPMVTSNGTTSSPMPQSRTVSMNGAVGRPTQGNVSRPISNQRVPMSNSSGVSMVNKTNTTTNNSSVSMTNKGNVPMMNKPTGPIANKVAVPMSNHSNAPMTNKVNTPMSSNNNNVPMTNKVNAPMPSNNNVPMANKANAPMSSNNNVPMANKANAPMSNNSSVSLKSNSNVPMANKGMGTVPARPMTGVTRPMMVKPNQSATGNGATQRPAVSSISRPMSVPAKPTTATSQAPMSAQGVVKPIVNPTQNPIPSNQTTSTS